MIFSRTSPQQQMRLERGGLIDRGRAINFTFDGESYTGHQADTLASALLANGVKLVGRSFKYHRPRGIVSAGPEEPNALVELRSGNRIEPNTRATMIDLYHGLEATSQNRWPSLKWDVMELNDLASSFLFAGFYYKTFMGFPGWHFYEEKIRAAAGMGLGTHQWDPDSYEKVNAHCDVLVVGGGPSGLAAALAAGRKGARVILLDETSELGGRLKSENELIDGEPSMNWVRSVSEELASLDEVRVLTRTTGFGYYDDDFIGAVERVNDHLPTPPEHQARQRLWRIRAKRVILATGAIERPLVFAGNDRPGVMLASAVRTYLNQYAVKAGNTAVVFANNDDGYRTALDLHAKGVDINTVVDTRKTGHGPWREKAEAAGLDIAVGSAVAAVHGRMGVTGVDLVELDGHGGASGTSRFLACDFVATSGGWSPSVHLHSQATGQTVWNDALAAFVPGEARQNHVSIGACDGDYSLRACLDSGLEAGTEAASDLGFGEGAQPPAPRTEELATSPLQAIWSIPTLPGRPNKRFVDFQDDVTTKDIELSHQEGFISVEHLKRYTTLGMGTDQGKTSNINGHALMAEALGEAIPVVGTTRFRPPFTPVPIGVFAGRDVGRHFAPVRRSGMHDWHEANGAVMVEAGQWMRPQYYLQPGEPNNKANMDRAIEEEVVNTRTKVGIVDVSTLGKIDIQGPDSAEFLNRVYTGGFKTLPIGKARYGIMLREDGLVDDDGTTTRIGEHHYVMTTTTAHAGPVMAQLEWFLEVIWPELDVRVCSVTEQWSAMALAGPNARKVLEGGVDQGHDVSNKALPYLGYMEATVGGVPVRIYRISFSGELSYEVNAPADYAQYVWEQFVDAGQAHGLKPYGLEAMGIMRIEKGHVAGPELDGRTTIDDIGLGKMASSKKWYVGRGMMDKPAFADPARPKLVGLKPVDGKTKIRAGSLLIKDPNAPPPVHEKLGHVSSTAYLSPTLGHPISLGFLSGGREKHGTTVWAVFPLKGEKVEVEVCDPVFVDPKGEKLYG